MVRYLFFPPPFLLFSFPEDKLSACCYICRYSGLFTSSPWSSPLSHVRARVCVHIAACELVPVSFPSSSVYQLLFHNHLPEGLMAPCRALGNYGRSFVKQLEARGVFAFQSCRCHGPFFSSAGEVLAAQILTRDPVCSVHLPSTSSVLLGEL